jgi:hypothetical protein
MERQMKRTKSGERAVLLTECQHWMLWEDKNIDWWRVTPADNSSITFIYSRTRTPITSDLIIVKPSTMDQYIGPAFAELVRG